MISARDEGAGLVPLQNRPLSPQNGVVGNSVFTFIALKRCFRLVLGDHLHGRWPIKSLAVSSCWWQWRKLCWYLLPHRHHDLTLRMLLSWLSVLTAGKATAVVMAELRLSCSDRQEFSREQPWRCCYSALNSAQATGSLADFFFSLSPFKQFLLGQAMVNWHWEQKVSKCNPHAVLFMPWRISERIKQGSNSSDPAEWKPTQGSSKNWMLPRSGF